jgi:hypothetical protein
LDRLDTALVQLFEMFPESEPSLVQEVYLGLADRDREKAIELLLQFSKGEVEEKWETVLKISIHDATDFPALSTEPAPSTIPSEFVRSSSYLEKLTNQDRE